MRLHKDIAAVVIFAVFFMFAVLMLLCQFLTESVGWKRGTEALDGCGGRLCRALAWALEVVE